MTGFGFKVREIGNRDRVWGLGFGAWGVLLLPDLVVVFEVDHWDHRRALEIVPEIG